jgi:hypothetical protein
LVPPHTTSATCARDSAFVKATATAIVDTSQIALREVPVGVDLVGQPAVDDCVRQSGGRQRVCSKIVMRQRYG